MDPLFEYLAKENNAKDIMIKHLRGVIDEIYTKWEDLNIEHMNLHERYDRLEAYTTELELLINAYTERRLPRRLRMVALGMELEPRELNFDELNSSDSE